MLLISFLAGLMLLAIRTVEEAALAVRLELIICLRCAVISFWRRA